MLFAAQLHAADVPERERRELRLDRLDQPAPEFNLGAGHTLADCHGQWLFLHFWATWCSTCISELPALNRLRERAASRPVSFLAVAVDTANEAYAAQLARELAPRLPLRLQSEAAAPERYWSFGLPVTYVIDPQGRLVARALGPRDWDSPVADALLASLGGTGDPLSRVNTCDQPLD
jgi:thiol-disulfide isomerase/thioredoxin